MAKTFYYNGGNSDTIKEYLVQIHDLDSEEVYSCMETASDIIKRIDMDDCWGECSEFVVYDVETKFGVVEKLEVHGCWHDMKNPLYIKVTHSDGTIEFDGYGTDH